MTGALHGTIGSLPSSAWAKDITTFIMRYVTLAIPRAAVPSSAASLCPAPNLLQFPTDYRNTTRWLTYDPNKWCIATWKFLGLASDLKTFSQNEIDKGVLQQKQKKLDRQLGVLDWGKPLTMLPLMEWDDFVEGSKTKALIAVAGLVHDVSDFIDEHPGGRALINSGIGKDATAMWNGGVYYHSNAARNLLAKYRVGILRGGGEVEIWKERSAKRAEMIRDYDYSIVGNKVHTQ